MNLAWRYHTGWPTTEVTGAFEEDDEGEVEIVPVFGPRNGRRVSDYHRLDLRASREWDKRRGTPGVLSRGAEPLRPRERRRVRPRFRVRTRPDDSLVLVPVVEPWGGILPSFGVTWEF